MSASLHGQEDEAPILAHSAGDDRAEEARSQGRTAAVVAVLTLVQLGFAVSTVLCGAAMRDSRVHPLVFALERDVLGASILFVAAHLCGASAWPHARDISVLCAIGVSHGCGQTFMLASLKHISVLNASVLAALMPASTMLLGHAAGIELLALGSAAGRYKASGLCVAVLGGLALVRAQHDADPGARSVHDLVVGNAYALAFCVGGSVFPLLQRRVLDTSPMAPITLAAWSNAFTAAALVLALPAARLPASWWVLPRQAWFALGYVVLITSAFNYACLAWCNANSSAVFVQMIQM